MSFVLMQVSLEPPSVEALREALRVGTTYRPADAALVVRDAFGILFKGLERDEAETLRGVLAGQGIATEVVADEELPTPPERKLVKRAFCQPEAFVISDPLNRPIPLPWAQVSVVCAGCVRRSEFQTESISLPFGFDTSAPDDGSSISYAPRQLSLPKEREWDRWLVEIVLGDGALRVALEAHDFYFAHLGGKVARDPVLDFGVFLREVAGHAPHALFNRGAFALRENRPAAPFYPSKNAFHEEMIWLLWRRRRALAAAETA